MTIKVKILIISIVVLISCQKREWDNPFDPDCPKEIFTPSGFKADQQGNLVKLSWTQTNKNISGFKVERKVGDGSWAQMASEAKNTSTWNDPQPSGGKLHEYRIYAFAGNNSSNQITTQITLLFTATISTNAASNITSSSLSTGGNISDDGGSTITSRGVCWNTTGNPNTGSNKTSDGPGSGVFASNLTNLSPNTTYYLKAYATNSQGTAYGNEISFTTLADLPTLTTAIVSTFNATSAVCGGEITNEGGAQITERGVCWSTSQNPTTAGSKQAIGSGTGVFSNTITGLTANTTYYVRAYAINKQGTAYGNQVSVTTQVLALATVNTEVPSGLTSSGAVLGGIITSDGNATVTERGVCFNTSPNPTTENNKTVIGSGIGHFVTKVFGLADSTTYYVRAYAINSQGTAYGSQVSFMTNPVLSLATVTTSAVSTFTSTTALLGGNVTSDGNATVTERGVCYSTSPTPTTANNKTVIGNGIGIFSTTVTGLAANTTYYVRAYAINSQGKAYGSQVSFTTSPLLSLATVTTSAVSTFTSTTALLGGNVTSDGNATVTERGVCYSATQNPTTANNKTVIGSGTGIFSTTITGLAANTTYYVIAYAINSEGTAYGSQVSFRTSPVLSLATVTTATVSTFTSNTALLGGNVTRDGNTTVTERGVCFNTSPNPTIVNNKTVIGSGTGTFSTSVTGLTANTTYYVIAYAINSQGTVYGAQVSFTTSPVLSLATVTTSAVSTFSSTTALLGGNVTSDGNTTVTERGVCYSTSPNPTTANNKTIIGNGTGTFSTTVTGLTANTTYYVIAYAINSQGTAYGSQVSFRTATFGGETVSDLDGNVYNTFLIGTQVWMAENLKTTKYRDGTSIPNVTDNAAWNALSSGAYCWYDNNVSNKGIYGALYNWYSVNTGKLCPQGWHVPTDPEWTTLENYLVANGYNYDGTTSGNKIGKSMATATGWNSYSGTGTVGNTDYPDYRNKSGFSALPGGCRYRIGTFDNIVDYGYWWSSTEGSTTSAFGLYMYYCYAGGYRYYDYKEAGFSVRCVRD